MRNAQLLGEDHPSPSEHIGHLPLAEFHEQVLPMVSGAFLGGAEMAGAACCRATCHSMEGEVC